VLTAWQPPTTRPQSAASHAFLAGIEVFMRGS